jgi:hypothetical protein
MKGFDMGIYLLIGILFTFMLDTINHMFNLTEPWTLKERIVCILLWPVFVIIFIVNLF